MNKMLCLAALALLAACQAQPRAKPPLEGAAIGGPFALTGEDGKPVTDAAFKGRYRIVYFGYTYCPDVCPTDVAALTQGLRAFATKDAARAAKIVPLFISIDPVRDTPAVLRTFTDQFDPRLIGLTGPPPAIAAAAKAYGVAFSAQKANADGAYLVDHTNVAYLMDPDGKPLSLLPSDEGGKAVAAELDTWVK
jgi:protein SCO1